MSRFLRLPAEERSAIIGAGLTERHARALLRIEDEELRRVALRSRCRTCRTFLFRR